MSVDVAKPRYCEEIGVDRMVFSFPTEPADKILSILDRWVGLRGVSNPESAAGQMEKHRILPSIHHDGYASS